MKKVVFGSFLLMQAVFVRSQTPYPTAPPVASNLVRLEYFIDSDPGLGLGKPIAFSPAQTINGFNFNADITGLPNGFHRIYLRSQNADGTWSLTNSAFFDNYILPVYASAAPAVNVVAAEYFIDTDPGFGNGTPIAVTAETDISGKSVAAQITGLAPGTHRIYIRTKDASGKWSLTNSAVFDNTAIPDYPTAPVRDPLITLEYFFDSDPGFGNGTAVSFSPENDLADLTLSVPVTALAEGSHTFYIRSRQNPWSLTAYAAFNKTGTLPVTWRYVQGAIQNESALISWATSYEENTSRFVVEYSTNGTNFISLEEIAATGHATGSTYSYRHINPSRGPAYYRIKQVDQDGQFRYSKTILLVIQKDLRTPLLFPNPARESVNLLLPPSMKQVALSLYENNGSLVKKYAVAAGQQNISLSVNELKPGLYYLLIESEGLKKTMSFTKL